MSSVIPKYGGSGDVASNTTRHLHPWATLIAKIQAYLVIRKVNAGLKEVKMMEQGKKADKPIKQLLDEL
jgi:hypothetical protein